MTELIEAVPMGSVDRMTMGRELERAIMDNEASRRTIVNVVLILSFLACAAIAGSMAFFFLLRYVSHGD